MHLELKQVSKIYTASQTRQRAVDKVSWSAKGGEVLGMLGPNGAGKTSIIRMILNIIPADEGEISVDGDLNFHRSSEFKRLVGYLPEERGLYKNRTVDEIFQFFGALKGLTRPQIRERSLKLLGRLDLLSVRQTKIEHLSKGMSQQIQIASCLLHAPRLLILDEPFSGLDPVNTEVVRELIREAKNEGVLVCLSTHMMGEVEALCDRIFMIHHGKQVLYGDLGEIRRSFAKHELVVDGEASIEQLACVGSIHISARGKLVSLKAGCHMNDFLLEAAQTKCALRRVEEAQVPLAEIFVSVVKGRV